MFKGVAVLTHPAPAHQDAPFHVQGRSSVTDPRFTFHDSFERCENEAGGFFQRPAPSCLTTNHPVTIDRMLLKNPVRITSTT
jgi:hypothetical protein